MGIQKRHDVVPARITEAREYCLLTGEELAKQIGVTRQAIFQFEKNTATPKPAMLYNISVATAFPIDFFYTPSDSADPNKSIVLFRGSKAKTEKIKKSYGHTIKWANEIKAYLGQYVNWIENNVPTDIDYDFENPEIDCGAIEYIAEMLRQFWGLGDYPLDDICGILENNGVVICEVPFRDSAVDAYSEWVNGTPYIFYGGKRNTAVGFNFSIAHELGHLLLHQSAQPQNKVEFDLLEQQANYFAGAFLMPQRTFSKTYVSSSIDSFVALKAKWQASLGAMIFRSFNLDLISENQKNYLFKQMGQRGYRTKEPLDDEIEFNKPSILFKAIELLDGHNILPLNEFIDSLPLGHERIAKICSIPDSFMQKVEMTRQQPQLRIVSNK